MFLDFRFRGLAVGFTIGGLIELWVGWRRVLGWGCAFLFWFGFMWAMLRLVCFGCALVWCVCFLNGVVL